jgi:hypothetical protein
MRKLYIIVAVILAGMYSCKKDSQSSGDGIIGTWIYQRDYNASMSYGQIYEFRADSTTTFSTVYFNKGTKQILGYEMQGTGKYSLSNNMITIYFTKMYGANQGAAPGTGVYAPLDKLVPYVTSNSAPPKAFPIIFNADKTSFTFDFGPCAINELCPSAFIYQKQ